MTFIIFGRSLFLTAKWAKATNNRAFYQPPYYDTQDVKYQRQNPFLFIRKKNCYQYQKRHSRERLFATIFHGSIQLNRKLNQLVAGAKKVVSSEHILFTGMRLNVNTCWPKAEKWQMTNCELTKEILMWWVHQASKANKKTILSLFFTSRFDHSHTFFMCALAVICQMFCDSL